MLCFLSFLLIFARASGLIGFPNNKVSHDLVIGPMPVTPVSDLRVTVASPLSSKPVERLIPWLQHAALLCFVPVDVFLHKSTKCARPPPYRSLNTNFKGLIAHINSSILLINEMNSSFKYGEYFIKINIWMIYHALIQVLLMNDISFKNVILKAIVIKKKTRNLKWFKIHGIRSG